MEDKRKEIQFITSDYDTLFTVKDGDSIKLTDGYDGSVRNLKCRYLDETHLTIIGQYRTDYHICQFAEIMERNGSKCEEILGQKPMLNILAAEYGSELKDVEIPMTESAIKKLVGGDYSTEELRGGYVMLRGKEGAAVCKNEDGVLTSVHPYWATTFKHELGVVDLPSKKPSMLDKLDGAKDKAIKQIETNPHGDKLRKLITAESR